MSRFGTRGKNHARAKESAKTHTRTGLTMRVFRVLEHHTRHCRCTSAAHHRSATRAWSRQNTSELKKEHTMTRTATMTLQTIWDCRWSRPGYRVIGVQEHLQPEKLWVCVRRGERVGVTEEECANCPHWEAWPVQYTVN
jgi:hypothetical protein